MRTPYYLIDEAALVRNLEILKSVSDRAGVKILLAQKAFSCAAVYPLCAKYLAGTTASSLFEARHGHDNFGGETVDHIVFNSPRQVARYGEKARAAGVSVGLRVNPEVSVATTPAYDPCRPGSRLGTTRGAWDRECSQIAIDTIVHKSQISIAALVDGLHFHCLCEQGVEELRKVLVGFEEKFGDLLPQMKWVNFGGGHHITRADYDVDGLVALLNDFRARHPHLTVYLEPGEAIALNAGTLVSRVLEIQPPDADGIANAILDTSAACHMPDVLEMPYTPRCVTGTTGILPVSPSGMNGRDARSPSERNPQPSTLNPQYVYRFGGPTCLAGDTIGTYSFPRSLHEGDRVVFEDMAIYSMVKNNTFNGVNLPDIVLRHVDGTEETLRRFGYDDFAVRLG